MSKIVRVPANKPIKSYKGFNIDYNNVVSCRSYAFTLGTVESLGGRIRACSRGFHACKKPIHVLPYYHYSGYDNTNRRFAIVHQWGKTHHERDKVASSHIKVVKWLTCAEFKNICEKAFAKNKLADAKKEAKLAISRKKKQTINNNINLLKVNDSNKYFVVNKKVGATIIGTTSNQGTEVVSIAKNALLVGYFNKFKGKLGCEFIHINTGNYAKVDGKKIKEDTYYKPTPKGFVKC